MVSQVEPPLTFVDHFTQCVEKGLDDKQLIVDTYNTYIKGYSDYVEYARANLSVAGSVRSYAGDHSVGGHSVDGGCDLENVLTPEWPWSPKVLNLDDDVFDIVSSRLSTVPELPAVVDQPSSSFLLSAAIQSHLNGLVTCNAGSLYDLATKNIVSQYTSSVPWFFVGACQLPSVLSRIACVPNPRKLTYRMQLAALSGYEARRLSDSYYAGVKQSVDDSVVGMLMYTVSTVEEEHIKRWMESVGLQRHLVSVYLEPQQQFIQALCPLVNLTDDGPFDFYDFVRSDVYSDYLTPMAEHVLTLRRYVHSQRLACPETPVADICYSSDSDIPTNMNVKYTSSRYHKKRMARLNRTKRLAGLSEESSDSELYGSLLYADYYDGSLPVCRVLSSLTSTHKVRPTAQLAYLVDAFNATSSNRCVLMECDARLSGAYRRQERWYISPSRLRNLTNAAVNASLVDDDMPSPVLEYALAVFNSVSSGSRRYIVAHRGSDDAHHSFRRPGCKDV